MLLITAPTTSPGSTRCQSHSSEVLFCSDACSTAPAANSAVVKSSRNTSTPDSGPISGKAKRRLSPPVATTSTSAIASPSRSRPASTSPAPAYRPSNPSVMSAGATSRSSSKPGSRGAKFGRTKSEKRCSCPSVSTTAGATSPVRLCATGCVKLSQIERKVALAEGASDNRVARISRNSRGDGEVIGLPLGSSPGWLQSLQSPPTTSSAIISPLNIDSSLSYWSLLTSVPSFLK